MINKIVLNKLQKFAEMAEMPNVIQCPREQLLAGAFPYKGDWSRGFFKADRPIVLELGCGRGEYTVALAERDPQRSFIGIDIKGARMYTGARDGLDRGISNAGFLRTEIELIESFFAPGEVEEIWITFPDPQMKKVNKRLTSARFLTAYRNILNENGIVNLKTDSPFLYEFTRRIIAMNSLEVLARSDDLYPEDAVDKMDQDEALKAAREIKTAYERQWLARGKRIKFIRFRLKGLSPGTRENNGREFSLASLYNYSAPQSPILNPEESDIERDDYRAYPRFDTNMKNPI